MYPSELPPLDCHAHIAPDVTVPQVNGLGGAFVFAMTRSPAEGAFAAARDDRTLLWGWGAHPGLPAALREVTPAAASAAADRHVLIGEVGLDHKGDAGLQRATFKTIIDACSAKPVLLSVHSTGRTREVIDMLGQQPHPGTVLHWFNGTADEIREATALGCYFSVNNAMTDDRLALIPRHRMLPETDFPSSRRKMMASRPGDVMALEQRLATRDGCQRDDVRRSWYVNLARLCGASDVTARLPQALREAIAVTT